MVVSTLAMRVTERPHHWIEKARSAGRGANGALPRWPSVAGADRSVFHPDREDRNRMSKIIAFDEEARRGLERGMNQLADAVKAV